MNQFVLIIFTILKIMTCEEFPLQDFIQNERLYNYSKNHTITDVFMKNLGFENFKNNPFLIKNRSLELIFKLEDRIETFIKTCISFSNNNSIIKADLIEVPSDFSSKINIILSLFNESSEMQTNYINNNRDMLVDNKFFECFSKIKSLGNIFNKEIYDKTLFFLINEFQKYFYDVNNKLKNKSFEVKSSNNKNFFSSI
jgi:hypothetical protein